MAFSDFKTFFFENMNNKQFKNSKFSSITQFFACSVTLSKCRFSSPCETNRKTHHRVIYVSNLVFPWITSVSSSFFFLYFWNLFLRSRKLTNYQIKIIFRKKFFLENLFFSIIGKSLKKRHVLVRILIFFPDFFL